MHSYFIPSESNNTAMQDINEKNLFVEMFELFI